MEKNKFCPLIGGKCIKENCTLYHETQDRCAVMLAAGCLCDLAIAHDDDGINVRFDND